MGPDQLSGVLKTIQRSSAKSQGREIAEEKTKASTQIYQEGVLRDSECYSTSAVGLDDVINDPWDRRDVLGCRTSSRYAGYKDTSSSCANVVEV